MNPQPMAAMSNGMTAGIPAQPAAPTPAIPPQQQDLQRFHQQLALQQAQAQLQHLNAEPATGHSQHLANMHAQALQHHLQQIQLPPMSTPPLQSSVAPQATAFQNPTGYMQATSADQHQALSHQELINEYRQKHPELVRYEDYIAMEVNRIIQESLLLNQQIPSERAALELGIARFKDRFRQVFEQERAQLLGPAVNRMAMTMDVNPGPMASSKLTPDDIWNMSRDDFNRLDQKISKRNYV